MEATSERRSNHSDKRMERSTLTDVIFVDLDEPPRKDESIPSIGPSRLAAFTGEQARAGSRHSLSRLAMNDGQVRGALARQGSLRPLRRPASSSTRELPTVSILTFATGDAAGLARKLENTLTMCRHAPNQTEVIVGFDGADAAVKAVLEAYALQGVRTLSCAKGGGALATWTRLTHAAQHEIVVFSEVSARMAPDALDLLLSPMRDTGVGMTVPSYVPCVDDGVEVRACLNAATSGLFSASYTCVAVRRHLLRRPAHDTLQPGLVTALNVLSHGQRVVSLPKVRVFYPEDTSPGARFRRIAERTRAQLQAARRQHRKQASAHGKVGLALVREGLKHIPLLAAWLGCASALLGLGWILPALTLLSVGMVGIARASGKLARSAKLAWIDGLGVVLSAGLAQAYGLMRARA